MTYTSVRIMCLTARGRSLGKPDCKDHRLALNVYGQTKLEGELAVSSILGEILHRAHRLGIWAEWKEFYQDDAACRQDTIRHSAGGQRPDRDADLYVWIWQGCWLI